MNHSITEPTESLTSDLQAYLSLCEEVLSLAARESQALSGQADYQPVEFDQKRKNLLPGLESLLIRLRDRRTTWQHVSAAEREHDNEVKSLFQNIQSRLMKVLLLDRENQQAMLRRGLVPAKHLPAAARQQPHFVAKLYQRHSVA
jgi:hypothetical protein